MKKISPLLFAVLAILTAFYQDSKKRYEHLRLNQVQLIGSHNSYKQAIDPELFEQMVARDSVAAYALDYSHPSIREQLDLGLRNLEIDVLADEIGGRYARPLGFALAGDEASLAHWDSEGLMQQPGFKVLHVQDLDFRSHYKTFAQCLADLKQWSEENPGHYPVYITLNAKDEASRLPGGVHPEKFTTSTFNHLDAELQRYLGRDKLLTPDDVRGTYASLRQAVVAQKWPTLKEARGRFVFILDENPEKRAAYRAGHPSLRGRLMFMNAEPSEAEAAILIMNDPQQQLAQIQQRVREGFLVRTRADANTVEARKNDLSRFEAAMQSGAQIITTDYYTPSTHFNSPYQVRFSDGSFFRVNPLLQQ